MNLYKIKYSKVVTGENAADSFYSEVFRPILDWKGDDIPVSQFLAGGYMNIKGNI